MLQVIRCLFDDTLLDLIPLQYSKVLCTTLHFTTLHFTTLHCTQYCALHFKTTHVYNTAFHGTFPHHTELFSLHLTNRTGCAPCLAHLSPGHILAQRFDT